MAISEFAIAEGANSAAYLTAPERVKDFVKGAQIFARKTGRRANAYVVGDPVSFWADGAGGSPQERVFSFPMCFVYDNKR